ncbi:MAG: hypothetical protein IT539_15450 [Bradyrhizobiaceae bacterium]|nr:hypothetical protein [Bradyrhizobiaceae bacterium]
MPNEIAEAAIKVCIKSMTELLEEAASLGQATKACIDADNMEAAFKLTLDIEPLLHAANYLIQAASTVRRRGRPPE